MKHLLWNLITSLKNGSLAKKPFIYHPRKNICEDVLKILWSNSYISGYKIDSKNRLIIFLKYEMKNIPSIKKITSISKPGKRIYYSFHQITKINSTNVFMVVSTTKGLKSLDDCKKLKIGGELVLSVT